MYNLENNFWGINEGVYEGWFIVLDRPYGDEAIVVWSSTKYSDERITLHFERYIRDCEMNWIYQSSIAELENLYNLDFEVDKMVYDKLAAVADIRGAAAILMCEEFLTVEQYLGLIEMIQEDEVMNEHEKRNEAYRKVAEYLWHKGAPADVYEQWLDICIKRGAL